VSSLSDLQAFLTSSIADWRTLHLADLQFWRRSEARLMLVSLIALVLVLLIARSAVRRRPGRHQVVLPAVPASISRSPLAFLIHVPLALFLIGLLFFVLAISDPYTALIKRDVTYPGRRIALVIDASSSMRAPFLAQHLNARAATDYTFFTTVGAAKRFVEMRLKGKFRDLMALIEFGNEAYVVTPFTNDYDNILLSISLIGDWTEFMKFPDQGTTIGLAIEQSVGLFKAFDFLDASGNLMLIFSDGQDTQVMIHGKSVQEILAGAVATKIPVFFIRTSYNKGLGAVLPDDIWKPAVEATGGKFYPAGDESAILNAIKDIDRRSGGRVEVKRYSNQQPKFASYAFMAASFWTLALMLQLTVPYFRKFP